MMMTSVWSGRVISGDKMHSESTAGHQDYLMRRKLKYQAIKACASGLKFSNEGKKLNEKSEKALGG